MFGKVQSWVSGNWRALLATLMGALLSLSPVFYALVAERPMVVMSEYVSLVVRHVGGFWVVVLFVCGAVTLGNVLAEKWKRTFMQCVGAFLGGLGFFFGLSIYLTIGVEAFLWY